MPAALPLQPLDLLGHDQVLGGPGIDVPGTEGADTLSGTADDDTIEGLGGDDILWGLGGADTIDGGAGADTINGGDGDNIQGGDGDDLVLVDGGTSLFIDGGADNDTVRITADATVFALGVEHFEVASGVSAVLDGEATEIVLLGAATIAASSGSDTIIGSSGNDSIVAGGGDSISGGEGNDIFLSGSGTDSYDGGGGVDTLSFEGIAFAANVDLALNLVMNDGSGSGFNETITGVENLIGWDMADFLRGDGADNSIAGGGGGDSLQGRGGADTLDGNSGADTMTGGDGDDLYYVESAGDRVTEISGAGSGTDRVISAITLTLGANVENLTLAAGAGVIDGTGNALANAIAGNESANSLSGAAGDDTLDGGGGTDTLDGGADNDTYVVGEAGVTIVEADGGGTDTVLAEVSYVLGAELETLVLAAGAGAISGTGNGADNLITGNESANTLDGAGGADTLQGGQGDDTYVVDVAGVTVTEGADGGRDTVRASVDYVLGAEVENLELEGAVGLKGSGNGLDNQITGTGGDDELNGGFGADTLFGGGGDDTYLVHDAAAVIREDAGQGYDMVRASVDYTLSEAVERLALRGGVDIDGTGNGLANRLGGNRADNRLDGAGGDDTLHGGDGADSLDGGAGQDVLKGGAGADSFVFSVAADSVAAAPDRIVDFEQGSDLIDLSGLDDSAGALHFTGARHFDGEAGEVIARQTALVTWVEVDLDGDRSADLVVLVNGPYALTDADFVL